MIYLSVQDPLTIVRLLISIGIVSMFYSPYFLHSERSREFFYAVCKIIQFDFALL